jgi:hypothetical protein
MHDILLVVQPILLGVISMSGKNELKFGQGPNRIFGTSRIIKLAPNKNSEC